MEDEVLERLYEDLNGRVSKLATAMGVGRDPVGLEKELKYCVDKLRSLAYGYKNIFSRFSSPF